MPPSMTIGVRLQAHRSPRQVRIFSTWSTRNGCPPRPGFTVMTWMTSPGPRPAASRTEKVPRMIEHRLDPFRPDVWTLADVIQVMTVNPGLGGQPFACDQVEDPEPGAETPWPGGRRPDRRRRRHRPREQLAWSAAWLVSWSRAQLITTAGDFLADNLAALRASISNPKLWGGASTEERTVIGPGDVGSATAVRLGHGSHSEESTDQFSRAPTWPKTCSTATTPTGSQPSSSFSKTLGPSFFNCICN